jgi:hypothetical protein
VVERTTPDSLTRFVKLVQRSANLISSVVIRHTIDHCGPSRCQNNGGRLAIVRARVLLNYHVAAAAKWVRGVPSLLGGDGDEGSRLCPHLDRKRGREEAASRVVEAIDRDGVGGSVRERGVGDWSAVGEGRMR